MKRICLFVSIFILSLSTIAFAADGVKLGSVDLVKVAQESEAGKKAMGELKGIADKYQDALKTRQTKLEKLQAALAEKGKSLSPAKRSVKEKELQQIFLEYQQYAKNAQQEFAKKETELSKPIRDDLEKLVKEYGRTNGYTAIAHKEGLIYIDSKNEVKELTDDILKQFNAAGKK
jgi:outer membrane protein